MDILEALFTRRSIRKYTTEPVSEDDLRILLKAAMLAPSACNEQPWEFVVAEKQELRDKLSELSTYTKMAQRAPLAILVCGNLDKEKAPGMWVQDCSAAIENLLLAARGRNIGGVWCGIHPVKEREEKARQILGLPERVIPFALVCLGHPDQKFHEEDRYNENCVHREKW